MFTPFAATHCFQSQCSIPQYSSISNGVTELFTRIICIPFDGVDDAPITGFHNSNMVGNAVSAPVEVYDRAGSRDAVPILPLASGAKPFHAGGTVGVLGYNPRFNITALVGYG